MLLISFSSGQSLRTIGKACGSMQHYESFSTCRKVRLLLANNCPRSVLFSILQLLVRPGMLIGLYVCMLAISDRNDKTYFNIVMKLHEAQAWIKENMTPRTTGRCLGDENNDMKPLADLAPLIAPLLNITAKGDLLVFCLTDILHGIPLHAAVTNGHDEARPANEHSTLIERNPIVYTFSMTTFHRCTTRSFNQVHDLGPAKTHGVVLGVYEDTENGAPLEPERQETYDLWADVAQQNQ